MMRAMCGRAADPLPKLGVEGTAIPMQNAEHDMIRLRNKQRDGHVTNAPAKACTLIF